MRKDVLCLDCGKLLAKYLYHDTPKRCWRCHSKTLGHRKSHRLYTIWHCMKTRCYNPNVRSFDRYGGNGIQVCPEWKDNYPAFQEWAFANGYKEGLTIDRIDLDSGYSPANCRWATRETQARNRKHCLTAEQVKEIRKMMAAGVRNFEICAIFGASKSRISKIRTRTSWKTA